MPMQAFKLKSHKAILARLGRRSAGFSSMGAGFGLLLTGLIGQFYGGRHGVWLIAPLGASAVLLFAVPASPLAQPWPVLGGNLLSAVVGVLCAKCLGVSPLSAGLAGGLAILLMQIARCLHPPGGAVALTAVLASAGPMGQLGLGFALFPVAINTLTLLAVAYLFHRISGHSYPHRPLPVLQRPTPLSKEDLVYAMQHYGDDLDIDADDLYALVQSAQQRGLTAAKKD